MTSSVISAMSSGSPDVAMATGCPALDGPLLLYLSSAALTGAAPQISQRLGRGWKDLVQRVCRP